MANKKDEIPEHEPKYLFKAIKARKKLLDILNDRILFCLIDPLRVYRECSNYLDDMIQSYKFFNRIEKNEQTGVERYLAIGIPGGSD